LIDKSNTSNTTLLLPLLKHLKKQAVKKEIKKTIPFAIALKTYIRE
jgi:hypothetical protein